MYQWIEKFKTVRSNMEDELCSDQPSYVLNEDVQCVDNLLQEDRRYTVSDVHHEMVICFLNKLTVLP